jgi:hypothetical protein
MKFKLGLLLGATGGYLVGSGKARQLWAKARPAANRKSSTKGTPTLVTDREVDAIIVDMTSAPLETTPR